MRLQGSGPAGIARVGLALPLLLAPLGAVGLETPRREESKPAASAAAPPPPPPRLPEPPLPVRQAQAVGLGQCAPILDRMSRQTLTSAYDVQSGWSTSDPARHVFQSIAALNTPGNTPPDGFAALIAAPVTAGTCDGVSLQVFPLAGDCQSAQKAMLEGGRTVAPLMSARIMQDARGNRIILLPAYNNTCIAIAVDTRFGSP